MSEQEQVPEVGAAMWGGINPFTRGRRLRAVPDEDTTPDEAVITLQDAAALILLAVGIPTLCVAVGFAVGAAWGVAVLGVLLIGLGVLLGGSSR